MLLITAQLGHQGKILKSYMSRRASLNIHVYGVLEGIFLGGFFPGHQTDTSSPSSCALPESVPRQPRGGRSPALPFVGHCQSGWRGAGLKRLAREGTQGFFVKLGPPVERLEQGYHLFLLSFSCGGTLAQKRVKGHYFIGNHELDG